MARQRRDEEGREHDERETRRENALYKKEPTRSTPSSAEIMERVGGQLKDASGKFNLGAAAAAMAAWRAPSLRAKAFFSGVAVVLSASAAVLRSAGDLAEETGEKMADAEARATAERQRERSAREQVEKAQREVDRSRRDLGSRRDMERQVRDVERADQFNWTA